MALVLIVDDDPNARYLLRTLCTHAGHEVTEAADAEQARSIAVERVPDLVITDLSLPAMSGTEFVRLLRRDERTRAVRIALYTATMRTAAIDDFIEMYGLSGVIPKPGEPAELLTAIDRALRD